MTASELLSSEKEIGLRIDALTAEDPEQALREIKLLLHENEALFSSGRAESACLARLVSRFLLHRKNKDGMVRILSEDEYRRSAYFGRLNTYKYSLVFAAKRLLRRGDVGLSREIIGLIENNPYRDDEAEDYSERFSFSFIKRKILESQGEYLKLNDETVSLLR